MIHTDTTSSHRRPTLLGRSKYLLPIVLLFALAFSTQTTDAAVELVYFRGNYSASDLGVALEWKTSYESRTAGYFIKRKVKDSADTPAKVSVILNGSPTEFIPADPNGTTGAEYSVIDDTIIEGSVYEYSLWEQEYNNSEPTQPQRAFEIEASPEETSSEISNPTPTATTASNNGSNATASPTATLLATSTPQTEGGATPQPGATSTTAVTTVTAEPTAAQTTEATPVQPTQERPTEIPAPEPSIDDEVIVEDPAPEVEAEPTLPSITPRADEPTSSGGVAEAAELPQDGTYPDPDEEAQENDQDYVPPAPTATPEPVNEQNVQQIGSGLDDNSGNNGNLTASSQVGGQAIEQISQEEISRNQLILWGGFISSLVLFVAVILAAIYMYRQRNKGG